MVSPGAATAEARGQARKVAVVQQTGTSCTVSGYWLYCHHHQYPPAWPARAAAGEAAGGWRLAPGARRPAGAGYIIRI